MAGIRKCQGQLGDPAEISGAKRLMSLHLPPFLPSPPPLFKAKCHGRGWTFKQGEVTGSFWTFKHSNASFYDANEPFPDDVTPHPHPDQFMGRFFFPLQFFFLTAANAAWLPLKTQNLHLVSGKNDFLAQWTTRKPSPSKKRWHRWLWCHLSSKMNGTKISYGGQKYPNSWTKD